MEAFLAEFKVYVVGRDKPEVAERLRVWRALASACGFEPGGGVVKAAPESELPSPVLRLLERERAKVEGPAPVWMRTRAIESLAALFDGDLGFAEELVASIEEKKGPLPAALATGLAQGHPYAEVSRAA